MRRRELIYLLGAAATWPSFARAESSNHGVPVVGVLWHAASADEEGEFFLNFRKAFSDLGYVEHKTIEFEDRFPAEDPDRFGKFAQELVERKPDVMVAVTALGARELRQRNGSSPIVFVLVSDPIGAGFIDSLARPGRNMTGLSLMGVDLNGKRLQLLKEAAGKLTRVGLLLDRFNPESERFVKPWEASAKELGMVPQSSEAPTPEAIEQAFAKFAQDGVEGVVIGPGSSLYDRRTIIAAAALKYKLPTISPVGEAVPAGVMMSYGPDFREFFRLAAGYVGKILKGAKPSDLPVEQPTKFELAINLKVAKSLGITIPEAILSLADETIE
jgi:putative tryptophan/tyrosine transport system substrate-binding protein